MYTLAHFHYSAELINQFPTFFQLPDDAQVPGMLDCFKAAAVFAGIGPSQVLIACWSSGFSLENIATVSLLLSDVTKLSWRPPPHPPGAVGEWG